MQNTGNFTTFNCYTNDLMACQSGLYELVPSKFVVFTGADESVGTNFNSDLLSINTESADTDEDKNNTYHVGIREVMYEGWVPHEVHDSEGKAQRQAQETRFGTLVCAGDINLLSHDMVNGIMYNEVYVHVDGAQALTRYVMVSNPSPTPITDTTFSTLSTACFSEQNAAADGDNDAGSLLIKHDGLDTYITFNLVLVLYNVRNKIDGTLKYADVPMGVYRLDSEQKLYVEKDSLYGGSTSWSTRISLAMPYIDNNPAIQTEDQSTTYNTMIGVIEQLGTAIETMQKIVGESAYNLAEVKAYWAEFKNNRHINVPYVVGDAWYVNGRYVTRTASEDSIKSAIKSMIESGEINIGDIGTSGGSGDCGPGCDSGSYDKFIEEVSED